MANISDVKVEGGPQYRRKTPHEDITVRIQDSRVIIIIGIDRGKIRGGYQQATRAVAINRQETFASLLKLAQVALKTAFEELGEYRIIRHNFPVAVRESLEFLAEQKISDAEIAQREAEQAEKMAEYAKLCPWMRLEAGLKSSLADANVVLPE